MSAPVALYDSGLGGLTVFREVVRRCPAESLVYFGDTARVPYGPRSVDEIIAFNQDVICVLLMAGAKAIGIACNTSSAIALPKLQATCPVPLLGLIEGGARAAVAAANGGRVGVIATEATVRHGAYARAIAALSPVTPVCQVACPAFVPLVEGGNWKGEAARQAVRIALSPFRAELPAALVLGCTHYPLLAELIAEELPGVTLIDPAIALADRMVQVLGERRLTAPVGNIPAHRFLVSGDPEPFYQQAKRIVPGLVETVQQHVFTGAVAQSSGATAPVAQPSNTQPGSR